MSNKYKILIVEDDTNISNFVKTILETSGYQVIRANNGKEGQMMFLSHSPDIVILDLGLPDMDGIDFIRSANNKSDISIIVLSARADEKDKVEALDLGASDYITKPFGTEELLARVRAALRNSRLRSGSDVQADSRFCVKDMVIDYDSRTVMVSDKNIKFTQTEYNIVETLSMRPGRVFTYSEIIKKVWGYSDSGSIKKLQVNMANIRKKLGEKPGENRYISNELGVGYRMTGEN